MKGWRKLRRLGFRDYLRVPRDAETLSRSLLRKFHGGYYERPHEYMSGDSFKAYCDHELSSDNWQTILMDARNANQRDFRFFVAGAPNSSASFEIFAFLESNPGLLFSNVALVLHNGDHFPSVGQIEFASKRFKRIYSTNWLGRSPNVYPIPIGLENQGYLQNGVLKDYLASVPTVMPLKSRPINLLVCFSLHTNLIERSKALMNALKVPGVYVVERPVTPKRYRDLVGKSRFVLSPPGNGIDCHRTWEALYLGAVPIVLKSKIDTNLIKDLPIWVVDNYSEVHEYSKTDLKDLYIKLWNNANLEKIRTPYWLRLIND